MGTTLTSTSAVVTTLVANLILFGSFMGCFLLVRMRYKRIYSPKSTLDVLPEKERPPALSKDPVTWIFTLLGKLPTFFIEHAGMDGYLFLRYLFTFACTFLFGIATFAILLPINATDGHGKDGFDRFSISNVNKKHRYYAHVFVGWVFYGSVLFVISRELFFYNSFRSAVLSSPKYAKKLSSRTVLFQNVPDTLLDEKQLYKIFNGIKRIYIARNARKLSFKVKKRTQLVTKLEIAENKLLKSAVKSKLKADKKGIEIEGNDINNYVPEKKRPRHRAGGMFSKKVDTIEYCKEEIPKIHKEVKALQKNYKTYKPKNSLFVEFENQYYAQLAYQSTIHHNPLRMGPAFTGIEPGDIYWPNIRLFWWERIVRRFIACSDVVLLIAFWAIPVAFIGIISNITYLTDKLHWLRWILNLPTQLLGIVTGLLPVMMLSLLNTFLPIFIRYMAKVAGAPTTQEIELFTQSAYFAFLIVNSFLVTALASSATSTVTAIIDDPKSAMNILALHLPTSSNFYISYICLQGLTVTSGTLLQIVGLFLYFILGALLDSTVRKKWTRYSTLGSPLWGTTYPLYTYLMCIVLAFSIIAPLIMAFAFIALLLLYIAFSHNLSFVMVPGADLRGLNYPRALFQLFTGIYIGEVCLIGILVVGKGWVPIVLQAIAIGFTIFVHVHLKQAFGHLVHVVPLDCMRPLDGVSETPSFDGVSEYQSKVLDRKQRHRKANEEFARELKKEEAIHDKVSKALMKEDLEYNSSGTLDSIVPLLADRDFKRTQSTNPIVRFLRPDVFLNYRHAKQLLPASYNDSPEEEDDKFAYNSPDVHAALPGVWIPRDPYNLSKIEVANHSSYINISDENATFDEKGKIIFLGEAPN